MRVPSAMIGALFVAACTGGGAPVDVTQPPLDLSGPAADLTTSGYPPPPYGNVAGAVAADFTFQGYFAPVRTTGLATAETYGEVSFDMLRRSGHRYALIQLAAYWCGPCLQSALAMAEKAPAAVPKGGLLMSIVTEGTRPDNHANRVQLESFIDKAKAPFTMTLDSAPPQAFMEDYFGLARDSYILIDLSTMKIVEIWRVDVDAALARLESLLP